MSSPTSSPSSSRSSSPERLSSLSASQASSLEGVGTGPDEFYEQVLPPWRATLRKFVMRNLDQESAWIARMQEKFRSPSLDTYFLYSSALGAHTCFMVVLPALYFFGYHQVTHALVTIIGFGVYFSSFLKDLVCSPRPFAPPVERLSIGSHHLEYGFPSTHSTNSVSIALYIFSLLHLQYTSSENPISTVSYVIGTLLLSIYTFSIVLGRLYTGMHSITDVTVGSLLGVVIWAGHAFVWVHIEDWLIGSPSSALHALIPIWTGPLVVVVACGVIVHKHPQPAEDCPCYEDAIAIVSVLGGILLARFVAIAHGTNEEHLFSTHMPGSPFAPFHDGMSSLGAAWRSAGVWWSIALLKLSVGIAIIFAWRLAVKFLLHSLLPPFFRFLAHKFVPQLVSFKVLPQGTGLPKRRFYTPATEYKGAVPTMNEDGLRTSIPSVIDLPGMLSLHSGEGEERRSGLEERNARWDADREVGVGELKKRKGRKRSEGNLILGVSPDEKKAFEIPANTNGFVTEEKVSSPVAPLPTNEEQDGEVKRYDVDGVGIFASGLIPLMFEVLGWGVRP